MPRLEARRRRAVVLGALTAAVLVACSPDGDPTAGTTGSTATTTSAPTTTTIEPTTTTIPLPTTLPGSPTPPELATVADIVDAVLLDETELLRTYPDDPFEAFRYEPVVAPNVCGDDIDATYPPVVIRGTQLSSDDLHLDIVEEIRVFRDPPHAQVAADAVIASLGSCTELPDEVTLRGPSAVTAAVGGDRSLRYRMLTPDARTVFVLVNLANATIALTFTRPPDEPGTRPTTTTSTSSTSTTTTLPGQPPVPADRDLAVAQHAVDLIRASLSE